MKAAWKQAASKSSTSSNSNNSSSSIQQASWSTCDLKLNEQQLEPFKALQLQHSKLFQQQQQRGGIIAAANYSIVGWEATPAHDNAGESFNSDLEHLSIQPRGRITSGSSSEQAGASSSGHQQHNTHAASKVQAGTARGLSATAHPAPAAAQLRHHEHPGGKASRGFRQHGVRGGRRGQHGGRRGSARHASITSPAVVQEPKPVEHKLAQEHR